MIFSVSDEARDDLEYIWYQSLEQFGETQADRYRDDILDALETIRRFPYIGAEYLQAGPEARAYPVGVHRIVYDANESRVVIAGIIHHRQGFRRR